MGELLEEGDTPSILAGESEEEPTLLRLPSRRSGDRLVEKHRYEALQTAHYSELESIHNIKRHKTNIFTINCIPETNENSEYSLYLVV